MMADLDNTPPEATKVAVAVAAQVWRVSKNKMEQAEQAAMGLILTPHGLPQRPLVIVGTTRVAVVAVVTLPQTVVPVVAETLEALLTLMGVQILAVVAEVNTPTIMVMAGQG